MVDVILAMTKNNGIGFQGKLPWHSKEELKLFKNKTKKSILIVGRKTAENLPPLKGRELVTLSSNVDYCNPKKYHSSLSDAIDWIIQNKPRRKIFVIGGAQVYDEIFSNWRILINEVHLSIMNEDFECDTFVTQFNPMYFTVKSKKKYTDFTHYVLTPTISSEIEYLSLLKNVQQNGLVKEGRNGTTKSMFGQNLSFDLTCGFPLLTTKKMFFRGVVEELLFFIRGHTDSNLLEDKNINIWKGNTNRVYLDSIGKYTRREGVMGPMYGYQWRHYNAPYNEVIAGPSIDDSGFDQLKTVIDQIRNNPTSRRILLTSYNPLQVSEGVLPPCHSITMQFYVSDGYLDMFCYNRSSDLFHGLPFNIASSSLFQMLIAKITGLTARNFELSLGDAHIYESHYDVVEKQLNRIPFKFPNLEISDNIKTLEDIENIDFNNDTKEFNGIELSNYDFYQSLKASMVS